MMRRKAVWQEDPELAAEAEELRTAPQKPNGLDDARRIALVPLDQMQPILTGFSLVQGLLAPDQMSCLCGNPGSGKTFFALSAALHVAAKYDWLGRRVSGGTVVYLAAEAGRRIYNRVSAWRIHNRDRLAQRKIGGRVAREVPIFALPRSLDLCTSEDDLEELIAVIRETCGDEVALIVVDTLSRVMAGGNENSPEDMGALVASADRLRDEFGSHVMLVHHFGKDASRGARGHSLLHAAIDTGIEVTRDEGAKVSMAKIVKQRDGEIGEKIYFSLRKVRIGEDEETGEEVTSCVVEPADEAKVAHPANSRTTPASSLCTA
jgi:predicted ATP-dependent serine protease